MDRDVERGLLGIAGASGLYGAGKYGKRAVARGIDTFGFGNVPTTYKQDPKTMQYLDNLLQGAKGKKRKMILQVIKTLPSSGEPVELAAIKQSVLEMEREMSIIKSSGRRVPKKLRLKYLNTIDMIPKRQDAAAILQRSLNQPISHPHSGRFIEGGFPQRDRYVKKALINKGLDVSKPLPEYNLSGSKDFIKSARSGAHSGDPRMRKITNLLKANKVKEARTYIESQKGMSLYKNTNGNLMVKRVPSYYSRGGGTEAWKEYRIGGHTQITEFKKGRTKTGKGWGKLRTKGFDITTYTSAGEQSKNIMGKARIALAGRLGQRTGIHTPVVTTFTYSHNKPGGGVKAKAKRGGYNKTRKNVPASIRPYNETRLMQGAIKKKGVPKALLKIITALTTRGRVRL